MFGTHTWGGLVGLLVVMWGVGGVRQILHPLTPSMIWRMTCGGPWRGVGGCAKSYTPSHPNMFWRVIHKGLLRAVGGGGCAKSKTASNPPMISGVTCGGP